MKRMHHLAFCFVAGIAIGSPVVGQQAPSNSTIPVEIPPALRRTSEDESALLLREAPHRASKQELHRFLSSQSVNGAASEPVVGRAQQPISRIGLRTAPAGATPALGEKPSSAERLAQVDYEAPDEPQVPAILSRGATGAGAAAGSLPQDLSMTAPLPQSESAGARQAASDWEARPSSTPSGGDPIPTAEGTAMRGPGGLIAPAAGVQDDRRSAAAAVPPRHAPQDRLPMISAPGAAIQVNTAGPKSISVGKKSTYEISVVNSGSSPAQALTVSFATPEWIEIVSTALTGGTKELLREESAARMVWKIERLEPGSSQRMTLDVIPRKAQVFDLNVEWALAPVAAAVQVQVTEPLLKMAISGPDEVQFGQSALYHVTIRNPGSGVAENVTVMLSEALGGERAALGSIEPGEEKNIEVELIARSAGVLDLSATVTGDGNLQDIASREIIVRRAQLEIALGGPAVRYAGSQAHYQIRITNRGDAMAQDVHAAIGLPAGVNYVSGIDGGERIDGGLRWRVGSLAPGETRTFDLTCQLNAMGEIQIQAGARGAGDLADAATALTRVETLADLVLSVVDPAGPQAVGEEVAYRIEVVNRGTRPAQNIDLVFHFAEGIEPTSADGRESSINPGEVLFAPLASLEPGQTVALTVRARATAAGSHAFRAQLTCAECEASEVAGGTTRFFTDETGLDSDTETEAIEQTGQQPLNSILNR